MVKNVNWLLKILLLQLLTNQLPSQVLWVALQLKLTTILKMLFSKLLYLMVNQFVRQVAVSTFVQNHHHVLKKVSITILSLKHLILLQLCCKNWQMERFLQAVFKRDLLIQSQSKFLQVLTMWMFALVQNWLLQILKMSLRNLVLDWQVMPINSQYLYHVVVGISVSKQTWLRKLHVSTAMKNCLRHFQKQQEQPVNWLKHKHFVVRFVPLLKVLDWRKSSHMLWQHLKKLWNLLWHLLTWLSWCGQWLLTVQPSVRTWSLVCLIPLLTMLTVRIVTLLFTK